MRVVDKIIVSALVMLAAVQLQYSRAVKHENHQLRDSLAVERGRVLTVIEATRQLNDTLNGMHRKRMDYFRDKYSVVPFRKMPLLDSLASVYEYNIATASVEGFSRIYAYSYCWYPPEPVYFKGNKLEEIFHTCADTIQHKHK
jgi:hypothetical protein